MNPGEINRFVKEMISSPEVLAAFFTGILFAGAILWGVRHFFLRPRNVAELARLKEALRDEQAKSKHLSELVDSKEEKARQLSNACERLAEQENESTRLKEDLL